MEGDRRSVNSELWHACAGPRISLPSVGSLVVYFPQGHSEQVAASTLKEVDGHIPNYPNLRSQLVCQLHNVALHADVETDEVFAQMTLQPVNEQGKELFLPPDVGTQNRQPNDFFCKTLTASDTSTHGGFSVPRRAAEKVFPSLDFTKQPPAQELRAKDLHDHVWTFRHIYRGQPKRHLLTTGWSVFVSAKRLVAGDSVLFIRDDKGQLLLGIRRANSRQQAVMPSSVLSSDSMHIGVLAAAAHAAATSSRFQVFYNPRTSPSEFVIPLSKYRKAVHFTQVSVGMRFRMVFETEESTLRRYMGTVTGIGDLDPTRWLGSKWRNLEVGWDESSAVERPRRVSLWEIEPVSTPFLVCPPSFGLRPKRPPGFLEDETDLEGSMKRCLTWLRGDNNGNSNFMSPAIQGFGGDSSWLQFQSRAEPAKSEMYDAMTAAVLQDMRTLDASKVLQQSSTQQGPFRFMQQRPQSMQQQPSNSLWAQQSNSALHQVLQTQQQLPYLSQQVLPPIQAQITQTQPMTVPQASPQTVIQPPLTIPLTQPCVPSSLSHPLYSGQFQHQHQQQQQQQQLPLPPPPSQQQQQVQNQQLLLQSSPQGQLQQSPQVHSHPSLSQSLTVLSQVQPILPQAVQSFLTQSHQHQALTQTQTPSPLTPQSLPLMQQSFSSQVQPSLTQTQQPRVQAGQLSAQIVEVHSTFPQMAFDRSPSSLNLSSLKHLPAAAESDLAFVSASSNKNYSSIQSVLGRTHGTPFNSDDNGQLTNLLRAGQNMTQQSQQQQHGLQQQHAVVQPSQQVMQQQQQQQQQHTQDVLPPAMCSLPQIETQLTGSWFGTQCESPILSNIQIGQSDTSSVITSCSYSLPSEPLDNPLLLSATNGSLKPRVNSSNKEGQCQPLNDPVIGSFSSSSGSFTSTTTDGNRVASGVVTNGVLEDAILPRTCSWSQVPAPVRTFTKVHISGSDVGRSIDLSRFKNYDELRWELARMFHIEGQLEDPPSSYWQLVFVDNVGDILMVGDDPWEEFVSCARAIKILSTAQFLQMNQEGLEQLSSLPMQQQQSSSSEDCQVWKVA